MAGCRPLMNSRKDYVRRPRRSPTRPASIGRPGLWRRDGGVARTMHAGIVAGKPRDLLAKTPRLMGAVLQADLVPNPMVPLCSRRQGLAWHTHP